MLDLLSYRYETKPYDHQRRDFVRSAAERLWADNSEMGCGKSKVLIDTVAALYQAGEIGGLLVVAPKGVYRNWEGEIATHLPSEVPRRVIAWSPEKTQKKARELRTLSNGQPELKVFLMNLEGFRTQRATDAAGEFLESLNCLFVIDESTNIKNPAALQTKALTGLAPMAPYRRILTGSPITQSPMDLYAQCAFLDLSLLGHRSAYSFRARYAVTEKTTLLACKRCGELPWKHADCKKSLDANGEATYKTGPCTKKDPHGQGYAPREVEKVVLGCRNLPELQAKLAKFSVRNLKRDCLDLPPKIYTRREVELTLEQAKAYREMKAVSKTVVAANPASAPIVLTQIMRLQQIACGFVKTEDGVERPVKSRRLDALMDTLEEAGGKAIIWANHVYCITDIADALRKRYGGASFVAYYGATSSDDREIAKQRFQGDDGCRFFLSNPQTGGEGITLTAAETVVYYSNSYRLDERLQSEDRAHRAGLEHPVTYVDLVVPGTVDEQIVDALAGKKELAEMILGDNWEIA